MRVTKNIIFSSVQFRKRQWHPTPVLFPGKYYGRRSLVGCSPWGCQESDMTERLHFHFSLSCLGEGNGNPLQCSCLENPKYRGAWWAAIYGVAQSRTQLQWLSSSSNSSVQSLRCVSDSLWPHELQHARPPCPSPALGVHPNSRALSQWCHPAFSSSVVSFSSCPQSLPGSGSFPMSQLFAWGGQSIGVSASASVLPMDTQDWSPLGWTGWISLQSEGPSRVFSNTTVQKHQFFGTQLSSQSNSNIHTWPLEKP